MLHIINYLRAQSTKFCTGSAAGLLLRHKQFSPIVAAPGWEFLWASAISGVPRKSQEVIYKLIGLEREPFIGLSRKVFFRLACKYTDDAHP
jgi:hypothetical protein